MRREALKTWKHAARIRASDQTGRSHAGWVCPLHSIHPLCLSAHWFTCGHDMKSIEMWRSSLYRSSLFVCGQLRQVDTHTHTHRHTSTHTHTCPRCLFFLHLQAVRISKCASGGEIEVFIITLYRGKGEAFKVANWQKGWLWALSVLSLWRRREKGACEGQILLGAE